ncbi:hypothetical protein [Streptomyces shenzhenensis]|uniref:Uncharacterized protein n=1 Tax=Streptomyces shenzhenensis TaxID=943815 RepID=A0A3M0IGU8_9ACTN|nr:hypothetical protein [Streptomyces shenzhenensis]RMB81106.1 hypothetical protein CTZ28_36605 [Streptomyces shenzhenensis]
MSRSRLHYDAIEQRLRDALEARATSAELKHLRPAALPSMPGRSFLPLRRTIIVLFGLAAAAACALLAVAESNSDSPGLPADVPSHSPSPSMPPSPSSPVIEVPEEAATGGTLDLPSAATTTEP